MNDYHYAVVVGIDRYPGLSDLVGARADAEAFARWLEAPDGGALRPANVQRIIPTDAEQDAFGADPAAARPVREQVEDAIADLADTVTAAVRADAAVWDKTRLYLYAAGHGLAPSGGEGALYLANAREGRSRHLELAKYRNWCLRCATFREVVVFADCCRTRSTTVHALPPTLDECQAPLVERQSTSVVGYGSGIGEPTYESEARGYFTTVLLEGLARGPRDETGAVTAATLGPYLSTTVAELTKTMPHPQTAQLWFDAAQRVVFCTGAVPAPTTVEVTISFPAGYAGRVELVGPNGAWLGSHDAGTGPWRKQLEPGAYGVQPEPGEPAAEFANKGLFWVTEGLSDVQL